MSMESDSYNQVCGKIIGYQDKTPDAFHGQQNSIDQACVNGISLTHRSSPRKHIWTFAAAVDEVDGDVNNKCPCTKMSTKHRLNHPALLGVTTFVTQAVLIAVGAVHGGT